MANTLTRFWQEGNLSRKPYIHCEDVETLATRPSFPASRSFEEYLVGKSFGPKDNWFDFSLYPVPYAGDLEKAKVVILGLNPGLTYSDYWAEFKVRSFRERLERNLDQNFKGIDFPFMFLDPQFCWNSGFQWWERKLRNIVIRIASKGRNGSYYDALRFLSKRLACIELIPYHSASFSDQKLIRELPSAKDARSFVQERLVPKAGSGKITIIVTRQQEGWGIEKNSKNICVYGSGQARGASLGEKTDGGEAILKQLQIN